MLPITTSGSNTCSKAPAEASQPPEPVLRFSPTAWAKLLFLRDLGDTEVGGFGIAAADDLLYVSDVQLVRQTCTGASVQFDDASVADFFDRQVDAGVQLSRCARIWLHTHPGNSADPSFTDADTFWRVFHRTDWALMLILARGGRTSARLRFHVGPGGEVEIPVRVDYTRPFGGSQHELWHEEYQANVQPAVPILSDKPSVLERFADEVRRDIWDDEGWFPDWPQDLVDEEELLSGFKEPCHAGQQSPL
jgi:proteasome lid subunit RPN8/RPN11